MLVVRSGASRLTIVPATISINSFVGPCSHNSRRLRSEDCAILRKILFCTGMILVRRYKAACRLDGTMHNDDHYRQFCKRLALLNWLLSHFMGSGFAFNNATPLVDRKKLRGIYLNRKYYEHY